jgi:hypothetical protein
MALCERRQQHVQRSGSPARRIPLVHDRRHPPERDARAKARQETCACTSHIHVSQMSFIEMKIWTC